jgi:Fungal Zn(2)-Cys(6) binuclear cluster domain
MVSDNASSDGGVLARSPNSVGPSSSSKRNKPCQQCQKLKVKCERNLSGGPCQRCQSQNKECTYHEAPNKKRKKDPDEYFSCL